MTADVGRKRPEKNTKDEMQTVPAPAPLGRFVVIFATFAFPGEGESPLILPNQGLGRKIKCELSSLDVPLARETGGRTPASLRQPQGPSHAIE